MPILNYTTKVDYEKTMQEITKILVAHGANKIIGDYDSEKVLSGISFHLEINGNPVSFQLPCNYRGVLKAMKNDRKVPRSQCTEAQAARVSWRIVKTWVEAQMAIVEAELADIAEVFLPYAVTVSGKTLYNRIKENPSSMPLLNA